MIEQAFARYTNVQHVTELGTSVGITTLYLGLMARTRGGVLHTFDLQPRHHRVTEVRMAWLDNMIFAQEDVLVLNSNVITSITRPNNFVWLDNGNKKLEFANYLQYVSPDSVVFTHDWEDEIVMDNVLQVLCASLVCSNPEEVEY